MKSSEKILKRITEDIVDAAIATANKNYTKYYDICSTFNFLWSIYTTDKEVEDRETHSNWGGWSGGTATLDAGPLPEQEPNNGWYFADDGSLW